MTAVLVPFPLARRVELIQRQAQRALELTPNQGIRHIERQLDCQAAAMRRRGFSEDLITQEIASMEAAIRTAMWHLVFNSLGGVL